MTYKITLMPEGLIYHCKPGETILEAAMRQNIRLEYGCRRGLCGKCIGTLLEGSVHYDSKIQALEKCDTDKNQTVYCSAIPNSDLIIESTLLDEPDQEDSQTTGIVRTPCKVVELNKLCHDVIQMIIKLPDSIDPSFKAGQYLDFMVSDGSRRSFSIANAPRKDKHIELHIRHVAGGEYTAYIFDEMKTGEILRIELALGSFYLREKSERPIIMMGGGTGFAPLKSMIEEAIKQNVSRPIHLFWGVRTERDLYLSHLPKQWLTQLPNFRYTAVLSDPEPNTEMNDSTTWQGERGFVHHSVLATYPDLGMVDLYMSGPPIMIEAARGAFLEAGLPQQHMYSDAFEYNAHP